MFAMVLFGLGVIFSFSVGNASAASPIYVSTHGNNSWNGQNSSWINGTLNGPKATIKNATGTVNNDGTVYIANGTYNESNINVNKNMTIVGASQSDTIINGNQRNVIFIIPYGVNVTLQNLTLINGKSTHDGGAILNDGTLTVNDSTFKDNTVTSIVYGGGAICNYQEATLTVKGCTFTGNTATDKCGQGGAISNDGTLHVTGSNLIDNSAGIGGAIFT
jgi:predicted outer membrane repeat protein